MAARTEAGPETNPLDEALANLASDMREESTAIAEAVIDLLASASGDAEDALRAFGVLAGAAQRIEVYAQNLEDPKALADTTARWLALAKQQEVTA